MKDYRYIKEKIYKISLPLTLIILPFRIWDQIERPLNSSIDILVIASVIFPTSFTIYSLVANVKRKKFLKSNIKYEGTIIKYDAMFRNRANSNFYLYISFMKDQNEKVIRTAAYSDDPSFALISTRCYVYELNNKYYPANYEVAKSNKEIHVDIPVKFI